MTVIAPSRMSPVLGESQIKVLFEGRMTRIIRYRDMRSTVILSQISLASMGEDQAKDLLKISAMTKIRGEKGMYLALSTAEEEAFAEALHTLIPLRIEHQGSANP